MSCVTYVMLNVTHANCVTCDNGFVLIMLHVLCGRYLACVRVLCLEFC